MTPFDFSTAIAQAWNDHADDPDGVAARWPALQGLATEEPQIERLADLLHHVHGAHLGDWQGGATALQSLRTLSAYRDGGLSGQSLRRALASLAACAGTPPSADALSTSDRIRVGAMVVENLTAHDPARALGLLREALAAARCSGLPDNDPMHRAVAVASHNLACTLEETSDRSADERALMILAAQASREHWERAGTWLEVERAEYRLAMTWLQAGDPAQACQHARACLDIVAANDGAALERLFGWEALGLVERAAGHPAEHADALARARAAFAELAPDDQGWCADSIAKLAHG
ncbi:MAG: hypothetical protein ABI887_08205 [Burkholderiales bacterium]